MKKVIETTHQINAPLEEVWANVRTGAEWEKWMPMVASSEIDGEGTGARGVCHTHEGGDLNETIVKSDDQEKVFIYRIDEQSMIPVTGIEGNMKFSASGEGTKLDWSVQMEIAEENEAGFAEIKKMTEEVYAASAANLGQLVNS